MRRTPPWRPAVRAGRGFVASVGADLQPTTLSTASPRPLTMTAAAPMLAHSAMPKTVLARRPRSARPGRVLAHRVHRRRALQLRATPRSPRPADGGEQLRGATSSSRTAVWVRTLTLRGVWMNSPRQVGRLADAGLTPHPGQGRTRGGGLARLAQPQRCRQRVDDAAERVPPVVVFRLVADTRRRGRRQRPAASSSAQSLRVSAALGQRQHLLFFERHVLEDRSPDTVCTACSKASRRGSPIMSKPSSACPGRRWRDRRGHGPDRDDQHIVQPAAARARLREQRRLIPS